jgi:hypothetical protein
MKPVRVVCVALLFAPIAGLASGATFACPDPAELNAPSQVPMVYARFTGERGGTGSAYAAQIAGDISAASYAQIHSTELFTQAGANKGVSGAQHDLCRDAIASRLMSYGLDVEFHTFPYQAITGHNVIGTQTGVEFPDSCIIVSAHYDTVNNPGADDDASGVAAFLEIARVMSEYETAYTVKYIGWDREEQGKVGSTRYAQQFASDDIVAVVQIDMVAHDVGNNTEVIYGDNGAGLALRNELISAGQQFGNGQSIIYGGAATFSDHAPFMQMGVPAICFVEQSFQQFGCYHQPCDNINTPNYIDYDFATDLTRTIAGWLASAAGADLRASCRGDANGDRVVDFADLNAVLAAFGQSGEGVAGDVNCDGAVNFGDLNTVLTNFGQEL